MTAVSRTPWPLSFPAVVVHTTVNQRDAHPDYAAAKAGDADAAIRLAIDLVDRSLLPVIAHWRGRGRTHLLPVVADELLGFNAIPDGFSAVLSGYLDVPVDEGCIVQINKVGPTRAPSFQRLMTPAEFDGPVKASADYIIVDDHVGLGGTLSNLRGYIEARAGGLSA